MNLCVASREVLALEILLQADLECDKRRLEPFNQSKRCLSRAVI